LVGKKTMNIEEGGCKRENYKLPNEGTSFMPKEVGVSKKSRGNVGEEDKRNRLPRQNKGELN